MLSRIRARLGPALVAGWLVVNLAARPIVVDCPMHQPAAPSAGHQGGHHESHPPAHGCDCLGHCTTATPLCPVLPTPSRMSATELVVPAPALASDAVPLRPHHLIPFANGPPTASLT
jgi:hypothetical protein